MDNYTKLFGSLVYSSIWMKPDHIRVLWITMLAIKNQDGVVSASLPALAKIAGISLELCEGALQDLQSPDSYSRNPDHEGRRIEQIPGGWFILNHFYYRNLATREHTAEMTRIRVQRFRERKREREALHGVTERYSNGSVTQGNELKRYTDTDTDTDTKELPRRSAPAPSGRDTRTVKIEKILTAPKELESFWRLCSLFGDSKLKRLPDCAKAYEEALRDGCDPGVIHAAAKHLHSTVSDPARFMPALLGWLQDRPWRAGPQPVGPSRGNPKQSIEDKKLAELDKRMSARFVTPQIWDSMPDYIDRGIPGLRGLMGTYIESHKAFMEDKLKYENVEFDFEQVYTHLHTHIPPIEYSKMVQTVHMILEEKDPKITRLARYEDILKSNIKAHIVAACGMPSLHEAWVKNQQKNSGA